MTVSRNIIVLLIIALFGSIASAQGLTDEQRKQALAEMRNFKHGMLIKELDLKKDQQKKFFDLYDAMDDELMAVGRETRDLERKVSSDTDASETEQTAAARALFEQKKREGEIELAYFDKFAEILTPAQMLKIKPAERKISMRIAQYHGHKKHQRSAVTTSEKNRPR